MDDLVRSQYRIPKDVDEWLKERARHNVSSKNVELISALRKQIEAEKEKAPGA